MSYGYSVKLLEANKRADKKNLGVQLGKLCIKHSIPVSKVAGDLGVSRPTVYNWFCGVTTPQATLTYTIRKYIEQISY